MNTHQLKKKKKKTFAEWNLLRLQGNITRHHLLIYTQFSNHVRNRAFSAVSQYLGRKQRRRTMTDLCNEVFETRSLPSINPRNIVHPSQTHVIVFSCLRGSRPKCQFDDATRSLRTSNSITLQIHFDTVMDALQIICRT